jgi:hypothetical protein
LLTNIFVALACVELLKETKPEPGSPDVDVVLIL